MRKYTVLTDEDINLVKGLIQSRIAEKMETCAPVIRAIEIAMTGGK